MQVQRQLLSNEILCRLSLKAQSEDGVSFFCRLPNIKIAWVNRCGYISFKSVQKYA